MHSPLENKLLGIIDVAFRDVMLEMGISIYIADVGAGPGSYNPLLEDCSTVDWRLLTNEQLESAQSTLIHTDIEGFRFYLPAYMTWTVRNHRISDNWICDHTIYSLNPKDQPFLQFFTAEQNDAVIRFLDYCAENEQTVDGMIARKHASTIREILENAG